MGVKFHIKGRVQGVGMRFFVQSLARRFNLTGYVKNCLDGTVEGVFCGAQTDIDKAFATLKKEHPGHIDAFDTKDMDDTACLATFKITY